MKKRKLAGGTPGNGDVISAKGIYLDMQPAEATYDGIALGEHARSGEASIRISDAEIASVHESAEACLGDTSAADAAYSTSQAYADGIANKTVRNGSIRGFNPHELEGEGEGLHSCQ